MTETKLSLGLHVRILDDSKLPLSFSLVLAHDQTSRHLFRGDRGSGRVNCRKTEAASLWALKFFGAELHKISSLEEEQRPEGSLLAPGVVALLFGCGADCEALGSHSSGSVTRLQRAAAQPFCPWKTQRERKGRPTALLEVINTVPPTSNISIPPKNKKYFYPVGS